GIDANTSRLVLVLQPRHVQTEGEHPRLHLVQRNLSSHILVATTFKPSLDFAELSFLLRIADDRIGVGSAQAIRHDSCGSVYFLFGRVSIFTKPREYV